MLHSFFDLCGLGIVETVYSADEVTGDPSDPLELHSLADFSVYILNLLCIHYCLAYLKVSGQSGASSMSLLTSSNTAK